MFALNNTRYREFARDSMEQLVRLNEVCRTEFDIGSYERWNYDLDTRKFMFLRNGVPDIVAEFQFIGTFVTGTWMWAWANESLSPSLTEAVRKVRDFGKRHGFSKLTKDSWAADESDAWEMAAIATTLTSAKCAYRCTVSKGLLFVVFQTVSRV
jgi:hypothetical protein